MKRCHWNLATAALTAAVSPKDATNANMTWRSIDSDAATVSGGLVLAVGRGGTTITITPIDSGYTDNCVVTVSG